MQTAAIILERPRELSLRSLDLVKPVDGDVVVEVAYSGISTGTERLLWTGDMPPFPGMGYPLVPGYETVGRVVEAMPEASARPGDNVFVPGAQCFEGARGLFGGAASHLVVPSSRIATVPDHLGEESALLALAATAYHAVQGGKALPDLIIGHGVLGRLVARLAVALGGAPVVWELDDLRKSGAAGYDVCTPDEDPRSDYSRVVDVSGAADLLDTLISRISPMGEVVLAGFYTGRISFDFVPAFMREARLRIAAEWKPDDLTDVLSLVRSGQLSLGGLITHRARPDEAATAYRTAFEDADCLKMIFDWRELS